MANKIPFPIVPTPTPYAREKFLADIYAAGYGWGAGGIGIKLTNQQLHHAKTAINYTHAYLHPAPNNRVIFFIEYSGQLSELLVNGTLVNSNKHFIEYAKRHFPQK